MNEVEQAWRLWHQLQQLSDVLWDRYDKEFMDMAIEDTKTDCGYSKPTLKDNAADMLPF